MLENSKYSQKIYSNDIQFKLFDNKPTNLQDEFH